MFIKYYGVVIMSIWSTKNTFILKNQIKPTPGTASEYLPHGMERKEGWQNPFFEEMTLGHFICPKPFTVSKCQVLNSELRGSKVSSNLDFLNEVSKCLPSNLPFIMG